MSSDITIKRIPRNLTDEEVKDKLSDFFHMSGTLQKTKNVEGKYFTWAVEYPIFNIGRSCFFIEADGKTPRHIWLNFPSNDLCFRLCEAIAQLLVREIGGVAYNEFTGKKIKKVL